jgi:hypothetical protein
LATQVDPADCKSGTPTQDGGKCGNSKLANSSISDLEEFLMLLVVEMLKTTALLPGEDTMESTRDGLSNTLIPSRSQPQQPQLLVARLSQQVARQPVLQLLLEERQPQLLAARPQPLQPVEESLAVRQPQPEVRQPQPQQLEVRQPQPEVRLPLLLEVRLQLLPAAKAGSGDGKLLTVRESDTESPLAAEAGNGVGKL